MPAPPTVLSGPNKRSSPSARSISEAVSFKRHTGSNQAVDAPGTPSLGLAGAEQRLFDLQLDIGQISVARRTIQLRVDYLTQLNTPAMLVASANVSLLATLQYSWLSPKAAGSEAEYTNAARMMGVAVYTIACSFSLASALWVLYTSNNLINLATMTTLSAEDLRGVQGAEIVLSIRMGDVRKWYIAAVFFMAVGLYAMILTLIEFYVALPASLVVVGVMANAIHSDHETAYHFEHIAGVRLPHRPEYVVSRAYRALCLCFDGSAKKGEYHRLGRRIEDLFEQRYEYKQSARHNERDLLNRLSAPQSDVSSTWPTRPVMACTSRNATAAHTLRSSTTTAYHHIPDIHQPL